MTKGKHNEHGRCFFNKQMFIILEPETTSLDKIALVLGKKYTHIYMHTFTCTCTSVCMSVDTDKQVEINNPHLEFALLFFGFCECLFVKWN